MKIPANTPSSGETDWVGPPDKVSNIRPYKFYQPENETPTEKKFREQRMEALEFNHDFWYKHNKSFFTVSTCLDKQNDLLQYLPTDGMTIAY